MHHSSTSTYTPNFIEIEVTFFGRTDGRRYRWTDGFMHGHLRPALLGRFCQQVNLKTGHVTLTTPINHFQPCNVSDVQSAIMSAPSKSCTLDPLPTDILKKFLPELLPFVIDLCNASLHARIPPTQSASCYHQTTTKEGWLRSLSRSELQTRFEFDIHV